MCAHQYELLFAPVFGTWFRSGGETHEFDGHKSEIFSYYRRLFIIRDCSCQRQARFRSRKWFGSQKKKKKTRRTAKATVLGGAHTCFRRKSKHSLCPPCVPLSLFVCLSFLSVCASVCLPVFVCLSVCLTSLSVLCLSLFACPLSVCLSLRVRVLFLCLSSVRLCLPIPPSPFSLFYMELLLVHTNPSPRQDQSLMLAREMLESQAAAAAARTPVFRPDGLGGWRPCFLACACSRSWCSWPSA